MSLRLYAKLRKRREFRKFSYNLKGCVIASWGKVTHGSKMHSISCSFYLFVLPSISSRALSSLALASYSSSMNSCCRFLPERKKSHRQSFATQRKGQIWQCFCHCLSLKIIAPWADSTARYILSYGAIHPKFFDQSVSTPETYPKFTCMQLKSSISDLPGRKEQGNDSPRVKKTPRNKRNWCQASVFILLYSESGNLYETEAIQHWENTLIVRKVSISNHTSQIKNKTKHKCTKRRQKNQFSQRDNMRDSLRGWQILEERKRLYFMGRDSITILFP